MRINKYSKNPIITKNDVPFKVNSIFNPGAVKYNGKYILLCRVELPIGRSSLVIAESKDGYDFKVSSKPTFTPEDHKEYYDYVNWGIEDARITQIDNKFYITYTGYSKFQPLVMLSETTDFINFKIHGPISEPSNKDCALFPEKIDNYYWKVDRPSAENRRDIWISRSPDLIHWGGHNVLQEPEHGSWEQDKIGSSSNPIKTKDGWLMLYHGVRSFGIGATYKIGVVLLDLKKPWLVIGKSKEPIISPDLDYERIGDVNNVVFSNGWIVEDNGDAKIYYSGADTNICLAETNLEYLLSVCK
ncbi:MAG: glycoside hydrolase family 130 protein [Ignavibacteriota bacterium]